jgi:lysyl-tRNA synthetase class 2
VPVPGNFRAFSREDWWDYIMVMVIELFLGKEGPEFLMAYPPSQAALAETYVGDDGLIWAKRFELYIENMELCNGYQELTDAIEQEERFKQDLLLRERLGKTLPKIDNLFLDALHHGMPSCSGVALGLDRLFMLAMRKAEIASVILFPDETA